ncbi:UDP-N-acetylmuramoyl-tripeptide--D-alanyl-D-alanine ligase [Holzapfeliella sp. JNUCC 72]
MKMMLSEIAKAIDATIDSNQDVEITEVQFDSRLINENALFVPIIGERDGHDFVFAAKDSGAIATLWQTDHEIPEDLGLAVLKVDDCLAALQKLAKYYLQKVNPKVVAVTGSNGKTTTKDMIRDVLSTQFNVHATEGNFNNEIGVPMTILNMKINTEMLVCEMGMDRPGQLTQLSQIASPDVAVITMIGEAHLEFFGTREKIAQAKMEITSYLKEDGYLIYNGDEPLLNNLAQNIEQDKLTFGFENTNHLYATNVETKQKQMKFQTNLDEDINFTLPVIGKHNVSNALAAIVVGEVLQIEPSNMQDALSHFNLTKDRMQWLEGDAGEEIMSDIYNSNPTATRASLSAFSNVSLANETNQRIVVLADMLELGEQGPELHANLVTAFSKDAINQVYLYGPLMANLYNQLIKIYPETDLHYYDIDHKQQLIQDLQATIHAGDLVLLKGSHGLHLSEVLQALL